MNKETDVKALINKAEESLRIAKIIANEESYGFSAARAYYAMLYAAQSLLLLKDLTFSKHSAVIAAFGKEYVKNGIVNAKYHQYLIEAFELRQIGDYEPLEQITKITANELIANAEDFVDKVKNIVNQNL